MHTIDTTTNTKETNRKCCWKDEGYDDDKDNIIIINWCIVKHSKLNVWLKKSSLVFCIFFFCYSTLYRPINCDTKIYILSIPHLKFIDISESFFVYWLFFFVSNLFLFFILFFRLTTLNQHQPQQLWVKNPTICR